MNHPENQIVLLYDVELLNYDGTYTIYTDGIDSFTAVENSDNPNILNFKLLKPVNDFNKDIELKKQVLDYCLGTNNYELNSEEVMLSDIFLHGKYISKL